MRRHGVLRDLDRLREFSCGKAAWFMFDQKTKDIEPGRLGEGGKRCDGCIIIHISRLMDILNVSSRAAIGNVNLRRVSFGGPPAQGNAREPGMDRVAAPLPCFHGTSAPACPRLRDASASGKFRDRFQYLKGQLNLL
ncbi:hypothetical protein D3C71_1828460 [compost metagenome]